MSSVKQGVFDLNLLLVEYRYFFPGVLAVAVSGLFVFLGINLVRGVWLDMSSLEDSNRKLSQVRGKLQALDKLSQGELSNIQEKVGYALPAEKPVFSALAALRKVADESEVKIADLSTTPGSIATDSARIKNMSSKEGKSKIKAGFQEMEITLELVGKFENLQHFFNELLELAPLMDVKGLRVASRGRPEVGDEQEFVGEMDLLVYWIPVDAEGVKDQQQAEGLNDKQRQTFEKVLGLRSFSLDGLEI